MPSEEIAVQFHKGQGVGKAWTIDDLLTYTVSLIFAKP